MQGSVLAWVAEHKLVTTVFGSALLILIIIGAALLRTSHSALIVTGLGISLVLCLFVFNFLNRQLDRQGRTEAALRLSEERYKQLVDFANDIIYKTDAGGNIIFANPTASRILGYPPAELIGRPYLTLARPEFRDSISRFYRTQFEKKTPNTYNELPVLTRDGRVIWLGQNVQIIIEEDRISGFQAVARDITEQKVAEEALRESESRLNAILDNASAVIYLKDIDGRYLLINRQFESLFHIKREEIRGKTDYDLFPREHADEFRANDLRVIQRGQPEESEETAPQDDGVHTFLSTKFPLLTANGTPYAVCGIATDISMRKRYEGEMIDLNRKLERTIRKLTFVNKELEAFTYSVSHDLRAPLRTINGYAQLLLNRSGPGFGEEDRRLLQVIRKNTQTMGQLIDDLLRFSHAGRREMQLSTIDMAELAQGAFDELVSMSPGSRVRCTIAALPPCTADRAMIRQVFINLISNAMKFTATRAEPTLDIGSSEADGQYVYFVRDNGVGFDMKDADKLFSVFERFHAEDKFEGTGVGLAIVQRVIQRHNGRVWAESRVDEGATFYFSLPKETSAASLQKEF